MSRQYKDSSSFKMAILSGIFLCCIFTILTFLLYRFDEGVLLEQKQEMIASDIIVLQEWYQEGGIAKVKDILRKRTKKNAEKFYILLDDSRNYLAGNIEEMPKNALPITEGLVRFQNTTGQKIDAQIHTFPNNYTILVGKESEDTRFFGGLIGPLIWVCIGLLLLVIFINFFISIYVVQTINVIGNTASKIMETGDLSKRIEIDTKWDDLSYLAQVLNSMLSRIELLLEDVKRVSDNIAHDLRTPLTRLKNQIDSLPQKPKEIATCKEKLLQESDHLMSMFNGLLRLANIESGKRQVSFKTINLDDVLNDVVAYYSPLAQDKNIRINLNTLPLKFTGDRDLLFQGFANIIDNSIKFTPKKGHINITMKQSRDNLILSFCDTGPGIKAGEEERIFRRLFRSDQSRNLPGHGLGLSFVKAIIKLHQGNIFLKKNNKKGACFEIFLPT